MSCKDRSLPSSSFFYGLNTILIPWFRTYQNTTGVFKNMNDATWVLQIFRFTTSIIMFQKKIPISILPLAHVLTSLPINCTGILELFHLLTILFDAKTEL